MFAGQRRSDVHLLVEVVMVIVVTGTGYPNQESRYALLLVITSQGLPLKTDPWKKLVVQH